MYIGMQLEGGKELDKKLMQMEQKVAKKVVRKAVRAALKPELAASKTNASSMVGGKTGGLIAKNLKIKPFKKQKKGSYGMSVLIKPYDGDVYFTKGSAFSLSSQKLIKGSGLRHYIPSAIEYGHAAPGDAGGVKIVPPVGWMRAAFDSWKAQGIKIYSISIKDALREVSRGG